MLFLLLFVLLVKRDDLLWIDVICEFCGLLVSFCILFVIFIRNRSWLFEECGVVLQVLMLLLQLVRLIWKWGFRMFLLFLMYFWLVFYDLLQGGFDSMKLNFMVEKLLVVRVELSLMFLGLFFLIIMFDLQMVKVFGFIFLLQMQILVVDLILLLGLVMKFWVLVSILLEL